MKFVFSLLIVFQFATCLHAQNKYWVEFKDKANVTFDPYTYFSERTIAQRIAMHIPLNDSSDYPINPDYLKTLSTLSDSTSWSSRWLNGIAVFTSPENAIIISNLAFVKSIIPIGNLIPRLATKPTRPSTSLRIKNPKPETRNSTELALLHYQTDRMNADVFSKAGFDGTGIRIAVFDAGFPDVDKCSYFSKLREGKKIISTYDFVCRKDDVFSHHWHGEATLSCIVGMKDSVRIGMATGAEVLLARTERSISERYSEEENWLAAAEWADKNGANIISSSLGYTYHRYFNTDMNGNKSLVARAATMAASKGILVVNAAGNEGSNDWHFIDTPGDADSVLTVGATDPATDMHIYFSSFGPASDGTLKPNVCATGEVMAAKGNSLAKVMGTSFSTPLVAGFAACAWQAHRQWTNMELFDAIEKSGNLYPYFDYAHGFGIPRAEYILSERAEIEPTFDFVIINNDIKLVLREKYSYTEAEQALGYKATRNFYYKIENKDGVMKKYFVLIAGRKEMLHFYAEDFEKGDVLTVHFEGYTSSIDFPELNEEK